MGRGGKSREDAEIDGEGRGRRIAVLRILA